MSLTCTFAGSTSHRVVNSMLRADGLYEGVIQAQSIWVFITPESKLIFSVNYDETDVISEFWDTSPHTLLWSRSTGLTRAGRDYLAAHLDEEE